MTDSQSWSEHEVFPDVTDYCNYDPIMKNGICLNPEALNFDKRYFIKWQEIDNEYGYQTTYIIGAQWVNTTNKGRIPVVVLPKIDRLDFLRMFATCFFNRATSDEFPRIYSIDWEAESIPCGRLDSILSPLLIVHFLSVVNRLLAKGLKKDYVSIDGNLNKVRGKLDIRRNEKINVNHRRLSRFYCRYQEFSANTPENRLIKKALLFSRAVLQQMSADSHTELLSTLHRCLAAMQEVDSEICLSDITELKAHKLFREYTEAIELARQILRKYDYTISRTDSEQKSVPPFWIDMPLLYEHYVYRMLEQAYPGDILYQYSGTTGRPDFLSLSAPMILDTKYIPRLKSDGPDKEIVRQLAGYARDNKIRHRLGISDSDILPCVVIYPDIELTGNGGNPFDSPLDKLCRKHAVPGLVHFYKLGVGLPLLEK